MIYIEAKDSHDATLGFITIGDDFISCESPNGYGAGLDALGIQKNKTTECKIKILLSDKSNGNQAIAILEKYMRGGSKYLPVKPEAF